MYKRCPHFDDLSVGIFFIRYTSLSAIV